MGGAWTLVTFLLVWAASLAKEIPTSGSDHELTGNITTYVREKCYEELGCFRTDGDFGERWVNLLPADRGKINTGFFLNTRSNPNTWDAVQLKAGDEDALRESPFDPKKPTKMIVHGFMDNAWLDYVKDMRSELLLAGDFNVLQVDWAGGAGFPYTQATANSRLVGAEIALFIDFLCNQTSAMPSDFHLIGHSLGAHISGYAGKRLASLGRITGLDPADPYFGDKPPSVRLDEEDAQFVDIIHSDSVHFINIVLTKGGFGLDTEIGTVDFYPNNGREQPGCDKSPVRDAIKEGVIDAAMLFLACSHQRVLGLMLESINNICPFQSFPCKDWDTFKEGNCLECTGPGCGYMGYRADKMKPVPDASKERLYLITGGEAPYCRYHYSVSVSIPYNGAKPQSGWLHIEFIGSKGKFTKKITKSPDSSKSFDIHTGSTYTALVAEPYDIGTVRHARVWWTCDSSWLNPFSYCWLRTTIVHFDTVEVFQGESQTRTTFCARNLSLEPETSADMYVEDCRE